MDGPRALPTGPWNRPVSCKGASIGSNATILCGITIGARAIVGAGAVVTKDVPGRGRRGGARPRCTDVPGYASAAGGGSHRLNEGSALPSARLNIITMVILFYLFANAIRFKLNR